MPTILLWLFVLNLGVVFGAGVYEARITLPRWFGPAHGTGTEWHPDEAQRDDVGRRFWGFTTTIPLTLLTLANAWAAVRAPADVRCWWLFAVAMAFADRVLTFAYFIPKMLALLRTSDSPAARASMRQWMRLNLVRLSLILIAWLAALQSFALFHQRIV